MLESSTRKLSTFPLTTMVASPCAAVVIGVGSFPPFRTAMYVSGNEVSPTSSLQLPTATTVASVTPPNQTCLRMSASVPLEVKEGLHQRRSYAYPRNGTCQATISNRKGVLSAARAARPSPSAPCRCPRARPAPAPSSRPAASSGHEPTPPRPAARARSPPCPHRPAPDSP